jgi:DNA-directed RNA polymerase subunit beta
MRVAGNIIDFTKIKSSYAMPDLLQLQKTSYDWLLGPGLAQIFARVFPIDTAKLRIEYVNHDIERPAKSMENCRKAGLSFEAMVRANFRLINKETGEIREQPLIITQIPLMTPFGTFLINGAERVIVSQLVRSPGVYFEGGKDKLSGAQIYMVTLIPDRGNWMEIEAGKDDVIYTRLRKKAHKVPMTLVLKALGIESNEEIERLFTIEKTERLSTEQLRSAFDQVQYTAVEPLLDSKGKEIIKEGAAITRKAMSLLENHGARSFLVSSRQPDRWIVKTLKADKTTNQEEAVKQIFKEMQPKERLTLEAAQSLLSTLLTDQAYNTFTPIGRYKINKRFGTDSNSAVLTRDDYVSIIRHLIDIRERKANFDDIDSLANRRIRRVGELLAEEIQDSMLKVAKATRDKVTIYSSEQMMNLQNVLNTKPVISSIRNFYGQSQLSQFMEQINPLSSLAHKRRLSSLGPGGLNRKRAGVEVRDIHSSHYSRICPIETPEGGNIGLINSLSSYAKLDQYGFITAPYAKVEKGRKDEKNVVYMDAEEEEYHSIAQANTAVDEKSRLTSKTVIARQRSEGGEILPKELPAGKVDYIDLLPSQIFGISASLIPFLEHDDANRALMGCNMQRQAVPLVRPDRARVSTAMEGRVVHDNGDLVLSDVDGIVSYVDAEQIRISPLADVADLQAGSIPVDVIPVMLASEANEPGILGDVRMVPISFAPAGVSEDILNLIGSEISREQVEVLSDAGVESFQFVPAGSIVQNSLTDLFDVQINDGLVGQVLAEDIQEGKNKVHKAGTKITETLLGRLINNAKIRSLPIQEGDETTSVELQMLAMTPIGQQVLGHRILGVTSGQDLSSSIGRTVGEESLRDLFARDKNASVLTYDPAKAAGYELFRVNGSLTGQTLAEDIQLRKPKVRKLAVGRKLTRNDLILMAKNGVTHVSVPRARVFELQKFKRTNQDTCINQHPAVSTGAEVHVGDLLANGYASAEGELALGKNLLVAYVPWRGYNYQDGVIVSERLVRDDSLSSIHIKEHKIEVRSTEFGKEEITRDPPNVSKELARHLDERGVVQVGAHVKAEDVLVGKITPRAEQEESPEVRVYFALFHDKARDYKNTSYKVPPGEDGVVIDVQEITKDNTSDALPVGVERIIKVYVAKKRKIIVGDKVAGRHGNKGVITRILPEEDMPFLQDGTPVDVILSPLGVPSRMNIGQLLEASLGIAARKLNVRAITPVFNGANEEEIKALLRKAGLNDSGKEDVRDGVYGKYFDSQVTVGEAYVLKLIHLAEDKMHARSTGRYTLITQQPIGGKAQFGGQRFGEMEVWALEAYGASTVLQEMLTIKSDDLEGRRVAYERLTKGNNLFETGSPESFNVLVKELRGLGLDLETLPKAGDTHAKSTKVVLEDNE